MGTIYKILNVVNDRFYIGGTNNWRKRKWQHWDSLKKAAHHCAALQLDWNEYGSDAFEFESLEDVPDEADLAKVEDTYLLKYAGTAECYNTAASSLSSSSLQAEVRKKISDSLKTIYAAVPSNHPRFGKQHSEETKARISASRKGKMAGKSHYRYGKVLSPEIREKIGATQRGKPKPPRVYTPEGLEKVRATMRKVAQEHPQAPKDWSSVFAKFPLEIQQRYDFSNAVYTGALTRITGIQCLAHGGFSQYSAQLRKGRGCPSCGVTVHADKKRTSMLKSWADPAEREKMMAARRKKLS